MSNKVYARISFDEKYTNTMEIKGSRVKGYLYQKLPTEYYCKCAVDEVVIDRELQNIQPDEIYIDLYTLSRLSYGFYRKYHKYIIEEFYEPQSKFE